MPVESVEQRNKEESTRSVIPTAKRKELARKMLGATLSTFFDLTSVDYRLFPKILTLVVSSFLYKKGFLYVVLSMLMETSYVR